MKKSLIALILLFGFIGCDRRPSPITIQNEQNNVETPWPAGSSNAKKTATTADHLSFVLGKPSPGTIIAESEKFETHEETLASTPISYLSKKDGFRVLMPSVPTVMSLDPTDNTHVRIYQTQVKDGFVQYNIFCHFFNKKL